MRRIVNPTWRYRSRCFQQHHPTGLGLSAVLARAVSVGTEHAAVPRQRNEPLTTRGAIDRVKACTFGDFMLETSTALRAGYKACGDGRRAHNCTSILSETGTRTVRTERMTTMLSASCVPAVVYAPKKVTIRVDKYEHPETMLHLGRRQTRD